LLIRRLVFDPEFAFADSLPDVLSAFQSLQRPPFNLDSVPNAFKVEDLFEPNVNGGFGVHLFLRFDEELLSHSNLQLRVFSIEASADKILTLYLTAPLLIAKYDSDSLRTTAVLTRNVPPNVWTHITVLSKSMNLARVCRLFRTLSDERTVTLAL
jgi:hypothetical protein